MLSSLPPREREIVDILYERGASTVTEIGDALADPLKKTRTTWLSADLRAVLSDTLGA